MKQPFLALLRAQTAAYRMRFRIAWLRLLGMDVKANCSVGKINCEWPKNVEIGEACEIHTGTTFWVQSPFKENNKIKVGNHVYIGRNTEFNCCDTITIGDNCLIASSTVFVDSSHTFSKDQLIARQPTERKGIVVEEDVWIGTGCKILYGVHLGKGCIIGAGAVVNKSVPAYEIWAGVPAKKIRDRQ